DTGAIYVADAGYIITYDISNGYELDRWIPKDGSGYAVSAAGMDVDNIGNLVIAAGSRDKVTTYSPDGTLLWEFDTGDTVADVSIGPLGNIFVISYGWRIDKLTVDGDLIWTTNFTPLGNSLDRPERIFVDSAEKI